MACCFVLTSVDSPPEAKTVFVYGSRAGQPTLDRDAEGGNPFATALVTLLAGGPTSFAQFKGNIEVLTRRASKGMQQPEITGGADLARWQFLPRPRGETRTALVIVFSSYAASDIGPSLPGAARDFKRVAAALVGAGFEVMSMLDPDRASLARVLREFARRSAAADVALSYTTGHGVEIDGEARLLLPYAREDGTNALPISELAQAARGKRVNLIFYAACRDKPE